MQPFITMHLFINFSHYDELNHPDRHKLLGPGFRNIGIEEFRNLGIEEFRNLGIEGILSLLIY
jgi:hypothetical protein